MYEEKYSGCIREEHTLRKKQKQAVFKPQMTEEARKKRTRNIIVIAVILVVATIACYWAMPKNGTLTESTTFDEQEVTAKAEQVVEYLNAEDYDSLKEIAVDEMQSIMNKERMDEAKARVSDDWGEFQSIGEVKTGEIDQRGVKAAVVSMNVVYSKEEINFTFAFNEDMKLASFGIQ